jgi:hypothetical protein
MVPNDLPSSNVGASTFGRGQISSISYPAAPGEATLDWSFQDQNLTESPKSDSPGVTLAMGISGFTEWFLKSFPRSVVKVDDNKGQVDHVLIDFNQFVHKVSRTAKNYDAVWKKLFRQLDNILNVTKPRQSVYIVMDGPGTDANFICA